MAIDTSKVYEGHFGPYTITPADRRGVFVYRLALLGVSLSFAAGTVSAFLSLSPVLISAAFLAFCLCLGVALATIHIYMLLLHRALWILWGIGVAASLVLSLRPVPLALTAYTDPLGLIGTGFVFAALTGVCIKESFCFGWWETAITAIGLPVLLLGHLFGLWTPQIELGITSACALALLSVGLRKWFYPVPDDIGDKSVHEHVRSGAEPS
jgi:uncharacterized integral membrane protein